MLAVVNGRPETMGLKEIIGHFVDFQFEVTTRKYKNMLEKELEKKEIQEGLIKACDVIDLIIEILRGSKERKQAKACLMEGKTDGIAFKTKTSKKQASMLRFTEKQASGILEMRLYRLIGLEVEALMKEHEATLARISEYEDVLDNYPSMVKVILTQLNAFKKNYGRDRRTLVENGKEAVFEEKKIEEMDVFFLMDGFGYGKTIDASAYERNKEAIASENNYVFCCKNTGKLCIFTNIGFLHTVKVEDLPFGKFRDKGIPIDNISNFDSTRETILFVESLEKIIESKMIFTTKKGMVKQVDGKEFQVSKRTVAATKLSDEDELLSIETVCHEETFLLGTKLGFFSKFLIEEIPEKKRSAIGVRGIKLTQGDEVEQAFIVKSQTNFFSYKEKEVEISKLKLTKRDTKGTKLKFS